MLALHRLRTVFVAERRSVNAAPGPSDSAASMVMANTIRAWDASYDLNFRQREAQQGVDAMGIWRQHLLERSGVSVTPVPSPNTPWAPVNVAGREAGGSSSGQGEGGDEGEDDGLVIELSDG